MTDHSSREQPNVYRSRPATVEAMEWTGDNADVIQAWVARPDGRPAWPPSARHLHGFLRAVIDHSGDYPEIYIDGVAAPDAPRGLYDQRRNEWNEWYQAHREAWGHRCLPKWADTFTAIGEVIALAAEEGVDLPPWVQPDAPDIRTPSDPPDAPTIGRSES
jgi:hypothetical protein